MHCCSNFTYCFNIIIFSSVIVNLLFTLSSSSYIVFILFILESLLNECIDAFVFSLSPLNIPSIELSWVLSSIFYYVNATVPAVKKLLNDFDDLFIVAVGEEDKLAELKDEKNVKIIPSKTIVPFCMYKC